MSDSVQSLVLDLLEWIGPGSRKYSEVMEAWRTSCPRLAVWEEANDRGFVSHLNLPGSETLVSVSALGRAHLHDCRGHTLR